MGRLNDKFVRADRAPGRYADGANLYLQVKADKRTGKISKSWLFRYRFAGREREMGLGKVRDVGLGLARKKAQAARELHASGFDPIEHRDELQRAQQLAAERTKTFKQMAEEYIDIKAPGWKNPKDRKLWSSTLNRYVYPIFGSTAVADVSVEDVTKALKPIWTTKAETAPTHSPSHRGCARLCCRQKPATPRKPGKVGRVSLAISAATTSTNRTPHCTSVRRGPSVYSATK